MSKWVWLLCHRLSHVTSESSLTFLVDDLLNMAPTWPIPILRNTQLFTFLSCCQHIFTGWCSSSLPRTALGKFGYMTIWKATAPALPAPAFLYLPVMEVTAPFMNVSESKRAKFVICVVCWKLSHKTMRSGPINSFLLPFLSFLYLVFRLNKDFLLTKPGPWQVTFIKQNSCEGARSSACRISCH